MGVVVGAVAAGGGEPELVAQRAGEGVEGGGEGLIEARGGGGEEELAFGVGEEVGAVEQAGAGFEGGAALFAAFFLSPPFFLSQREQAGEAGPGGAVGGVAEQVGGIVAEI